MARPTRARTLLIVHIPKTAGTTLRWIAARQYAASVFHEFYPGDWPQFEALAAASRVKVPRAVIGHFRFGLHARLPAACDYVTFLRDPVDQVVSMFNHLTASDDPVHRGVRSQGGGLAEMLGHDWLRNLQTQYLTGLTRAEVERDPDCAVHLALSNLEREFVGFGLVERFDESLRMMAPKLGWRVPSYPTLNRTADRGVSLSRGYLVPQDVERIRGANSCDERVYAYARQLFEARLRSPNAAVLWERVAGAGIPSNRSAGSSPKTEFTPVEG